jgi:dienelactone hydrolase
LRGSTTIFIGAEDDRATTADCAQLIERSNKIDKSNVLVVYENALHGFDNFEFPASKEVTDERGEHYHIGYNEQAREKSITDLFFYFENHLKI